MDRFLNKALDAFWKLTWQRVLLFAAAAFVLTVARYGWEHSETVVPGLLGNSIGIVAVALAASLIVLAIVVRWGIDFIESKSERMTAYLREQVDLLNKKDVEQGLELALMRRTVTELARNEESYRRTIVRMQRALAAAGIEDPPESKWGGL